MLKQNKGITLIALVITIIVLLILAGVSISAVMGENGIATKAKEASEATEKAQKEEELERRVAEIQLNGISGEEDDLDAIEEELETLLAGVDGGETSENRVVQDVYFELDGVYASAQLILLLSEVKFELEVKDYTPVDSIPDVARAGAAYNRGEVEIVEEFDDVVTFIYEGKTYTWSATGDEEKTVFSFDAVNS